MSTHRHGAAVLYTRVSCVRVIIYRYRLSLCSEFGRRETGKFHNSVVVEIRKTSVPQSHTSGATRELDDDVHHCADHRPLCHLVSQLSVPRTTHSR